MKITHTYLSANAVGLSTMYNEILVAGLHRAYPSTTLDKVFIKLLVLIIISQK
jgi:hypothetical protein